MQAERVSGERGGGLHGSVPVSGQIEVLTDNAPPVPGEGIVMDERRAVAARNTSLQTSQRIRAAGEERRRLHYSRLIDVLEASGRAIAFERVAQPGLRRIATSGEEKDDAEHERRDGSIHDSADDPDAGRGRGAARAADNEKRAEDEEDPDEVHPEPAAAALRGKPRAARTHEPV